MRVCENGELVKTIKVCASRLPHTGRRKRVKEKEKKKQKQTREKDKCPDVIVRGARSDYTDLRPMKPTQIATEQ